MYRLSHAEVLNRHDRIRSAEIAHGEADGNHRTIPPMFKNFGLFRSPLMKQRDYDRCVRCQPFQRR
jgi:hypothetical protein